MIDHKRCTYSKHVNFFVKWVDLFAPPTPQSTGLLHIRIWQQSLNTALEHSNLKSMASLMCFLNFRPQVTFPMVCSCDGLTSTAMQKHCSYGNYKCLAQWQYWAISRVLCVMCCSIVVQSPIYIHFHVTIDDMEKVGVGVSGMYLGAQLLFVKICSLLLTNANGLKHHKVIMSWHI